MNISRPLLRIILLIMFGMSAACTAVGTPTSEPTALPNTAASVEPAVPVKASEISSASGIEVTYFTPAQQEGPYYPVELPADRDNDLVEFTGATETPAGEVLDLNGVVYDANGNPVEGAVVEIWQTDSNGVYLHPDDPGTDQRDRNFQFYGESKTGPDGVYSFRTILPGRYEPRPRHIHVKVKMDGQELLTTQFYFADEVTFSGEQIHLVIDLAPAEDDSGNPIWVGQRDIILNIDQ
jgi:protocatechuate 3,4-dioxygenase beta subunit